MDPQRRSVRILNLEGLFITVRCFSIAYVPLYLLTECLRHSTILWIGSWSEIELDGLMKFISRATVSITVTSFGFPCRRFSVTV